MKLRAYAKINLTLDVTGRREDGYHTLDTVMQTVSVWDEVEIKKINKPGIRLFCNREYLPVDTKTPPSGRRSTSSSAAASPGKGFPSTFASTSPAAPAWAVAAPTRPRCSTA